MPTSPLPQDAVKLLASAAVYHAARTVAALRETADAAARTAPWPPWKGGMGVRL